MADRDPEAIKQEIDTTREQLAATVDKLTERASPRRIADDIRAGVISFVRKPPVTIALIGLGTLSVVLVVRRIRDR